MGSQQERPSNKKLEDPFDMIFSGTKTVSKSDNYRITKTTVQRAKTLPKFSNSQANTLEGSISGKKGSQVLTNYAARGSENGQFYDPGSEHTKSAQRLPKKPNMASMILKALQKNPAQYLHTPADLEQSDSCIVGIRKQ